MNSGTLEGVGVLDSDYAKYGFTKYRDSASGAGAEAKLEDALDGEPREHYFVSLIIKNNCCESFLKNYKRMESISTNNEVDEVVGTGNKDDNDDSDATMDGLSPNCPKKNFTMLIIE